MSDSVPAAASRAVFLSYASQDAAAVRRICEALRTMGVEVWFDQNELVGGDAWDAKIRKQIKECALFVPVISAATQARREGYFRIEWKLAAQRTHAIADGTPFLLPIVIDDTRDGDALVPEEFRAVQWTRLRRVGCGGQAPDDPAVEAFCARVQKLLGGSDIGPAAGRVLAREGDRSEEIAASSRAVGPGRRPGRQQSSRPWRIPVLGGLLILGVLALWQPWKRTAGPAAPAPAPATAAVASSSTATIRQFPRDPDLKRAMDLVNGLEANTEDFALAEDLAKAALAQRPMDAEAVTVMARVQVSYLFRGFDRSDERRTTARRYAERAVQLAPNDPDALAALGVYTFMRGGDAQRAHEVLDQAIALNPGDPFLHRHRDNALFADRKISTAVALASAEKTAALFPGDALAQYELARRYRDIGRVADMERSLDRAITLAPLGNAFVWKARIALYVRGDPAEAQALLDRVPSRLRSTERVVFNRWAYAMVLGQPNEGLNALDSLAGNWIEDFDYIGPKALLAAQLLELQGKPELARLQYNAALAEVRTQQARAPANSLLRTLQAWIMRGLGNDEEARALNRVALETIPRPYRIAELSDWWFTSIPACLLIGERATALQLIREAVTAPPLPGGERRVQVDGLSPASIPAITASARASIRLRLKLDPRMAPWRDDAEIVALLAEPAARE